LQDYKVVEIIAGKTERKKKKERKRGEMYAMYLA
jgi:hypothetical protein